MSETDQARREAGLVIVSGILLLAVLAGVYLYLHTLIPAPSTSADNSKNFFYRAGVVKGVCQVKDAKLSSLSVAVSELPEEKSDALACEFKDRIKSLKGYASSFSSEKSNEKIVIADQRVVTVLDEVDKIVKEAKVLSQNDEFFWSVGRWKWIEVVFWGEFGVIIGILAWVSTQMENGKFTVEMFEKEKYWYLTEVMIAPVVVAAVFFLLSGITSSVLEGITDSDVKGSVFTRLAVSFTLGLFIRRSLGVFDFIKDKLPRPKTS